MTFPLFIARFLRTVRPAFLGSFFKKLLCVKRFVFETPSGKFSVDPVSDIGYTLLSTGEFEPYMKQTLEKYLKPGAVFVDLGSNEGYFSVIASTIVGESGRVIAVEPQSRLQAVIQTNFDLNSSLNAQLVHGAVSDRDGELELHLTPDVNTGASGLHRSTQYSLPTEQVRSYKLSSLFADLEISRCELMKIDVEGAEYEAILGNRGIFENGIVQTIALELHPQVLESRGLQKSEITSFLEKCGYTASHPFGYLVFEWRNVDNL